VTSRRNESRRAHKLFGFKSTSCTGPLKNRSVCSEVQSPLFQEGDNSRIHHMREAVEQSRENVTSVTEQPGTRIVAQTEKKF